MSSVLKAARIIWYFARCDALAVAPCHSRKVPPLRLVHWRQTD